MAEEKKTPVAGEQGKLAKIVGWFKKLPARIAKPFKNMVAELRKVSWPSKKKWISSSITVLLFMLFMGVIIGLLDTGSTAAVKAVAGLNEDNTQTLGMTPEEYEAYQKELEAYYASLENADANEQGDGTEEQVGENGTEEQVGETSTEEQVGETGSEEQTDAETVDQDAATSTEETATGAEE